MNVLISLAILALIVGLTSLVMGVVTELRKPEPSVLNVFLTSRNGMFTIAMLTFGLGILVGAAYNHALP